MLSDISNRTSIAHRSPQTDIACRIDSLYKARSIGTITWFAAPHSATPLLRPHRPQRRAPTRPTSARLPSATRVQRFGVAAWLPFRTSREHDATIPARR